MSDEIKWEPVSHPDNEPLLLVDGQLVTESEAVKMYQPVFREAE